MKLHSMVSSCRFCCFAADAPVLAAHVGADAPGDGGGSGDWCGATLVICPLVAVIQWGQEIAKFTEPGSVKVRAPQYLKRHAAGSSSL